MHRRQHGGDGGYHSIEIAEPTAPAADAEATRKVAKIITSYAGRVGAAILTVGGDPSEGDVELRLTQAGQLTIKEAAVGLEPRLGRRRPDHRGSSRLRNPGRHHPRRRQHRSTGNRDPDSCADATGALTSDLTLPRESGGHVRETSLLPLAFTACEETGAVVADDLESLAPLATLGAAERVIEQDPDLDEDLAGGKPHPLSDRSSRSWDR